MKPEEKTVDIKFSIATANKRFAKKWKNSETSWPAFVKKLSETTRTKETLAEYLKMPKEDQDNIKDASGGFVGGSLKGGRRKAECVAWRQLVTLDADFANTNFWETVELMIGPGAYCAYSTHKHTPEKPRVRLVVLLDRPVTPDEYQAISRRIAADIGIDLFDDTTYEPSRLMYWPSTSADAEFYFRCSSGDPVNADSILGRYLDWTDQSFWPESSRTLTRRKKLAEKQGDPLVKDGIVGAFCRSYTIEEAIETFLPDVYEKTDKPSRYTYKEGSSSGGLVLYEDRFAYSHHGTDPIGGRLCNAFDLVRLHKFGIQDEDETERKSVTELPSYKAMMDFCISLDTVKLTMGSERTAKVREDFGEEFEDDPEWTTKLEYNKNKALKQTVNNARIILENEPLLEGKIAYNEFSNRVIVTGNLPWRKKDEYRKANGTTWRDSDDAGLREYLEKYYDMRTATKIADAWAIVVRQNSFHPVRDYLDSLEWDGIPRLETLLCDYLGAADTKYVRTVTRKALVGAVARIYQPGCKFDYMLVLVGPQGVGKSHLVRLLSKGWCNESLTTVSGKEAYEALQGSWLIEMAELTATKKAETEAVKHFISKQEDIFRVAYGKHTSVFPRQCIFIGTTNEDEFLKDQTGNRRFWPVTVSVEPAKVEMRELTTHEIDQIWAEAKTFYEEKEQLWLDADIAKAAIKEQARHTEGSVLEGLIADYLDTPLPKGWHKLDLPERRECLHGTDFGKIDKNDVSLREKVCAAEIWCELLKNDIKHLNPFEARKITAVLNKMPRWEKHKKGTGKLYFGKIYGHQTAYVRKEK